jgi:hypothetical protein
MHRLFQTAIGRLSVLSIAVALFVGAIWSWRTAPWYLLQDQYFITVSPDNSYLQRRGAVFNIQSNYDRDLLVSGPESIPFGVNPNTTLRLLDRGLDTSLRVDDIVARRYSENCGSRSIKIRSRESCGGILVFAIQRN